jgi:hypothetical protein
MGRSIRGEVAQSTGGKLDQRRIQPIFSAETAFAFIHIHP